MNLFCKGGAMKTLSKPRFSSKSGVSCYNHPAYGYIFEILWRRRKTKRMMEKIK